MCKYCENNKIMSNHDRFEVTLEKSHHPYRRDYHYISINHLINFGDLGLHKYNITIKINYCPICGRKLDEE